MKYLKKFESILKPHRLEERIEKMKREIETGLSSEVIEGDLEIDHPIYLEVDSKVREVRGSVYINIDKIPLWLKEVKVGGDFWCSYNNLTSLEGSPLSVGGDFCCSNNRLTSLEGGPLSIGGNFLCSDNQLTTLEGGPLSVGGSFFCSYNNLTSLEGGPKWVGGNFSCGDNPIQFTKEDVKKVTNVRGKIYI